MLRAPTRIHNSAQRGSSLTGALLGVGLAGAAAALIMGSLSKQFGLLSAISSGSDMAAMRQTIAENLSCTQTMGTRTSGGGAAFQNCPGPLDIRGANGQPLAHPRAGGRLGKWNVWGTCVDRAGQVSQNNVSHIIIQAAQCPDSGCDFRTFDFTRNQATGRQELATDLFRGTTLMCGNYVDSSRPRASVSPCPPSAPVFSSIEGRNPVCCRYSDTLQSALGHARATCSAGEYVNSGGGWCVNDASSSVGVTGGNLNPVASLRHRGFIHKSQVRDDGGIQGWLVDCHPDAVLPSSQDTAAYAFAVCCPR